MDMNMKRVAIIGWGKAIPSAVVSNDDLATILDTSDQWIADHTGIRSRHISHLGVSDLGYVAAERALAAAGISAQEIDMVVASSCTSDSGNMPNLASYIQEQLGASNAGCYDLNNSSTGFMYGVSTAASLIKTGVIKNAVIVGADVMSQVVPWSDRSLSVIYGDAAAAWVLQESDNAEGLIAEKLGTVPDSRDSLRIDYGFQPPGAPKVHLDKWNYCGQEIFDQAVAVMTKASLELLDEQNIQASQIALCVPHQSSKAIIEAVASNTGIAIEKCFVNLENYANTSTASVPLAMTEALEQGRIAEGDYVLVPSFGAGLSWSVHLFKWGEKVAATADSAIRLPPCAQTGLELIQQIMQDRGQPLSA